MLTTRFPACLPKLPEVDITKKRLGEQIRAARLRKRMTLQKACDALRAKGSKIDIADLSRIERGKKGMSEKRRKIITALFRITLPKLPDAGKRPSRAIPKGKKGRSAGVRVVIELPFSSSPVIVNGQGSASPVASSSARLWLLLLSLPREVGACVAGKTEQKVLRFRRIGPYPRVPEKIQIISSRTYYLYTLALKAGRLNRYEQRALVQQSTLNPQMTRGPPAFTLAERSNSKNHGQSDYLIREQKKVFFPIWFGTIKFNITIWRIIN